MDKDTTTNTIHRLTYREERARMGYSDEELARQDADAWAEMQGEDAFYAELDRRSVGRPETCLEAELRSEAEREARWFAEDEASGGTYAW